MGADSKIEWTHHTFNPWRGCTKVSEGCKFCYADTLSQRNPAALGIWGPRGTRVIAAEAYWRQPLKWNAAAQAAGERHRVFCASLADVFEGPLTMPAEAWPLVEGARLRLFRLIRDTPHLDWLLLTKRPSFAREWLSRLAWFADSERGGYSPYLTDKGAELLPNIWIGTSVENQAAADERIPELLKIPARVRFLSCEPLLGPVDLWRFGGEEGFATMYDHRGTYEYYQVATRIVGSTVSRYGIDWVIAGGESGAKARPMHPDWARSLRDQCQDAGVAFHFKQWGEWELRDKTGEPGRNYVRIGKQAAGRMLDGREWNELPTGAGATPVAESGN